jgi:hypothetical protein
MLGLCTERGEKFVALCNLSLVVLIIAPKVCSLLYTTEPYKRKIFQLHPPSPQRLLKIPFVVLSMVSFPLSYKRVVNWGFCF